MTHIAFIDVETTGLDPSCCLLLEFAMVVTDHNLQSLGSYHTLVDPSVEIGKPIDMVEVTNLHGRRVWQETAFDMHQDSGLIADLRTRIDQRSLPDADTVDEVAVDQLNLLLGDSDELPLLGGASVHFDRQFLAQFMPRFHERLHYRNLDVSVLKSLARMWDYPVPERQTTPHRAMDDILITIAELKFYRFNMFAAAESLVDAEVSGDVQRWLS